MSLIYDLDLTDLENYLVSIGLKPFRAKQIFKWLYEKRVTSFEEMSDISKDLQAKLNEEFNFHEFKIRNKQESKDGTVKFLFELEDGALIESVLMVFEYGYSACLSSQVGCNMGCKFCESGRRKKVRNLLVHEMVLQVLMIEEEIGERISHVVVMGIGEPFDNYDNLVKFLKIINKNY